MADTRRDALDRAFAMLSAQLEALGDYRYSHVDEAWVTDYHAALDILDRAGFDVASFRIEAKEVTRLESSRNYMTGEVRYSDKLHMDRYRFVAKLRAVVSYFELAQAESPRVLGFRPPTAQ